MKKINEHFWRQLFSERLKEIMQERGLSQNDIAIMAGVSKSQISRILSCKSTASIKVINNISYSLRIKIDSLVLFKELF